MMKYSHTILLCKVYKNRTSKSVVSNKDDNKYRKCIAKRKAKCYAQNVIGNVTDNDTDNVAGSVSKTETKLKGEVNYEKETFKRITLCNNDFFHAGRLWRF